MWWPNFVNFHETLAVWFTRQLNFKIIYHGNLEGVFWDFFWKFFFGNFWSQEFCLAPSMDLIRIIRKLQLDRRLVGNL